MKGKLVTFGILAALILVAGFVVSAFEQNGQTSFQASTDEPLLTEIKVGTKTFAVELALSEEEKSAGLSNRPNLERGRGMLFIFKPAEQPLFWMKDMRFALDIVWIYQGKIVGISPNVPVPAKDVLPEDLPTYSVESSVDYVLEINAGEASGLKIGDTVEVVDTVSV